MSDQRFEAAKAAMQGLLANPPREFYYEYTEAARSAVKHADALLAELARTAPQPDQAAPQGSAPDALLLARLEAAEAVCFTLSTYGDSTVARRQLDAWSEAKAAHEAQESSNGS